MISEIERNISDFITRLQNVSERFSLMVDHNEVIDAALPIFTKIDKLVSMLELLPENDDGSELATPTPPKPKTRRGRKRKAAQKSDVAEEEEISPEQALRMIKTEPGSMLEGQVDMECQSIDEGNVKFDAQDPDGDYGEHDDDDDDVVEHDEVEHDDEIDHDDDGDEGDAGDDTATDGLNLDDLASKSAAEAVKQLKFPRLKTIKKASPSSPRPCDECGMDGKLYTSESGIREHKLRTHRGKPRYSCGVCGKGFMAKSLWQTHAMGHLQVKQYKCGDCDKSFKYNKDLQSHRIHHSPELGHPCPKCSKIFPSLAKLKRHQGPCGGQKNYQCITCSKTFSYDFNMRRHQKSVHDL